MTIESPTVLAEPQSVFYVIDFDSTFMQVEALDELASIAMAKHPNGAAKLAEIKHLTERAMSGELSFAEALAKRIALLSASMADVAETIEKLKEKVSVSFVRNQAFFETHKSQILIVSSGFREIIEPIVGMFGIPSKSVFANSFSLDQDNNIIGYDLGNPLASDKGKVKLLKQLALPGDVYVIGDGYTDYEIREAGLANKFYAFTENVSRPNVVNVADHVTASLDEFLFLNQLPMSISYPKSKINVLLLENIHPHALELFKEEGYNVEVYAGALNEDELCEKIQQVSILGIRSKTQVTERVLAAANKLLAIGAFCIGTNQIDEVACMKRGVAVFNAPYSNTRSVVELAIGEIILLLRNITEKSAQLHQGIWNKSANNSFEIRGKRLGIVGYGSIGTQLSVLAESLGMQVVYFDQVDKLGLGNAHKCKTLDELLVQSDIISLHVDGRTENTHLIGAAQFDKMKQGVVFVNLSRGHVVDLDALVNNLKSGKVAGAALDVYPYEPANNKEEFVSPLRGLPNVILTPHIGGSTEEAQLNIGTYVPDKLIEYINTGSTYMSVNFPNIQLPLLQNAHRLMHVHHNVPGVLAKINAILAEQKVNIVGQYLKTNENIGYVITDIDRSYEKETIAELKGMPETIKFRVLY